LSAKVARFFPPGAKQRGEAYIARIVIEDVAHFSVQGTSLVAQVHGAEAYKVHIFADIKGSADEWGLLYAGCTCPAFKHSPCKHLWATLRACEQGNVELLPTDIERVTLSGYNPQNGPPPFILDAVNEGSEEELALRQKQRIERRWNAFFDALSATAHTNHLYEHSAQRIGWDQLRFRLSVEEHNEKHLLRIKLYHRLRKRAGEWGNWKEASIREQDLMDAEPLLQDLLKRLFSTIYDAAQTTDNGEASAVHSVLLHPLGAASLLEALCQSGRLYLDSGSSSLDTEERLVWANEDARTATVVVEATKDAAGAEALRVYFDLRSGDDTFRLSSDTTLLPGKLVLRQHVLHLTRVDLLAYHAVIRELSRSEPIPAEYGDKLISMLLTLFQGLAIDVPPSLKWEVLAPDFRKRLLLKGSRLPHVSGGALEADARLTYEDIDFRLNDAPQDRVVDEAKHRVLRCAPEQYRRAWAELENAGVVRRQRASEGLSYLPQKQLAHAVIDLNARGWQVEMRGKPLLFAQQLDVRVRSGVDWFDLEGTTRVEEQDIPLPQLLRAVNEGGFIELSDGSAVLLPESWFERLRSLEAVSALGKEVDGAYRFTENQSTLLGAFLEELPEVDFDTKFLSVLERLRHFEGLQPLDAPQGFNGQLRIYQKEGLGWLEFLERFDLGGCLADDMGLGKTVQILAHILARQASRAEHDPSTSLVVVPRSLAPNWLAEAQRFVPALNIGDASGADRSRVLDEIHTYDIVVMTYGVVRRDIARLKEMRFDYAILDEAQAIKTYGSQTAKACRALRAKHRLCLSGTPVENHLGELGSLFEFLNPGMVSVRRLRALSSQTTAKDEQTLRRVSQALRPFILRRTKEQVLQELPPKTEQTLFCELSDEERKHYDELVRYYRQSLLQRVDREGMAHSQMHILEALLRLRQSCCHLGLIDEAYNDIPSSKFETFLLELEQVLEAGHKALVFSQFTSVFDLLRPTLDQQGMRYAYLDGKTRKRQEQIDLFQEDPSCKVFLISLKAGGLGLNLTAADYVFVLDPWWNFAAEAQAVDRAHRIGQTRPVFVYRLIAKNTIEEKVLALQASKKKVADAILGADKSLISKLSRDDLAMLLE